MASRLRNIFNFLLHGNAQERLKLILISLAFFLVIGGYTITRTLKDTFFMNIVGREYLGWAKMWSIFILIPSVLLFSKLVDVLRRHQLLYFYSIIYGIGGLIIAYFIGHPTIGLLNTVASKDRLFGWIIYFFIEGYNPFVVSLFWSFSHSITSPDEAKTNYPLMVAASKLGGMLTAGLACWELAWVDVNGNSYLTDVQNSQLLLTIASLVLLCSPLIIAMMMKRVSGKYLHGYEAAYQMEKQKARDEYAGRQQKEGFFHNLFSGLILFVKYPYMLGIFGVISFWEIVNVFVNFERLGAGQRIAKTISGQLCYLLWQDFWVHAVGIIITLLGTRALIELLGERKSLILVPISVGCLVGYYLTMPSPDVMALVFILVRSINYGFASPLRESLYIPTSKDLKFKSKSWIDAFGVKVAKAGGSGYNIIASGLSEAMASAVGFSFFSCVIGLWIITAHLLGRRFEYAVEHNEVIGSKG